MMSNGSAERLGSGDGEHKIMNTKQDTSEPLPASDLLGCPFCGRPPRKETFSIHCDFCCVTMDVGHRSIIQYMWMNWNKRAGQPNVADQATAH